MKELFILIIVVVFALYGIYQCLKNTLISILKLIEKYRKKGVKEHESYNNGSDESYNNGSC